ncbi:MAG: transporter substrate-binding domain-containing protein, partial [Oscillospiraceae bacterium]|nr:transporter substrate-binding domain-containing protein [Oscillospiraceae bacterium]
MKKIIAIVLAAMMLLSITACGGKTAAAPINSVEDLKGKKIGVQLGTTGDIYASDIEGATVEQYNKGFEAVQALSQGKIDAVIIDDQVAFALAEGNDKVKVLEEPFTVEDYAICLAKENKDLTADMNKAIAEIKSSGLLDE